MSAMSIGQTLGERESGSSLSHGGKRVRDAKSKLLNLSYVLVKWGGEEREVKREQGWRGRVGIVARLSRIWKGRGRVET